MKKLLLSLFAVLTASFAYAGDGTKANPYTVADIQAMSLDNLPTDSAWVKAYIAGSVNNSLKNFITTATGANATNLMLADAQSETDYTKCIPVQLSSNTAPRTDLNLVDNPTNLGKTLLVQGKIQKYFGVAGIKGVGKYELTGEGITPVDPTPDPDPEPGIDFSQYTKITVAEFLQKADTENQYLLEGIVTSIYNTTYGNFYLQEISDENVKLQIYGTLKSDGVTNKAWKELGVDEKDTITLLANFTTYNQTPQASNAIYVSHKQFKGEKETIANTPETAYTVAKAKELIDAGVALSDEVYVKGIVSELGTITAGSTGSYYIKDAQADEFSIQVYKGNYLENKPFITATDLKVGDEVIVYGQLYLYTAKNVYEINSGNYLYSLNGNTKYEEKELTDPTNTPETAYSVSAALEILNNQTTYDMSKAVYVAGAITGITEVSTSNGNATYVIGDDKNALTIYRGKFLENHKFSTEDQIKVGDNVVVYGKLILYGETPEMAQNNYIYSLNGETVDAINDVKIEKLNGVIFDLSGRRVAKAQKGIYIVNGKKVVK